MFSGSIERDESHEMGKYGNLCILVAMEIFNQTHKFSVKFLKVLCFQVVKARNGELSSWEELGCLKSNVAFIILIDQFCRNIYRVNMDFVFIRKWS